MNELRVSLVQSTIYWEDKASNRKHYGKLLQDLSGKTDLAVLPEMFSTGFSMNCAHLAETNDGPCMKEIGEWARSYHLAICGSFLAREDGKIYNRAFFITPEGDRFFYDKRHLFRMGDENKKFVAGDRQVIVSYKGWNIRLIVCYDLRFPVWIRNVNKAYDLLICVANWPQAREKVWDVLLKARALENYSYVCGVNRIGEDGQHNQHTGNSLLLDFKGEIIAQGESNKETVITETLNKERQDQFREKFPVWKDADEFEIRYR